MNGPLNLLESEIDRIVAAAGEAGPDVILLDGNAARLKETAREHERRFRDLLEALPAAVYTTDAEGRITYFNEAAVELWGHRPTLGSTTWCGSWKLYWPDGTQLPHDECPMAIALKEDRPVRGMEAATERPDGTRVPFLPYPTPLHDSSGTLVGAVNMLVDITDRKRAEDQQALLVRELHHRVKNTLATVQAIIGSTARSAKSVEDFNTALTGRIGSLARTHLLLSHEGPTLSFGDILRYELAPFDDGSDARIRMSGPHVELPSQLAVTLGMAMHELTTNAAKHGALSIYGGTVNVTWDVTVERERRTLTIEWAESGGPAVSAPAHKGFGSRLLDFVLPGQIQAQTRVEYNPQGLRLSCSVPLPSPQS